MSLANLQIEPPFGVLLPRPNNSGADAQEKLNRPAVGNFTVPDSRFDPCDPQRLSTILGDGFDTGALTSQPAEAYIVERDSADTNRILTAPIGGVTLPRGYPQIISRSSLRGGNSPEVSEKKVGERLEENL